MDTVKWDPSNSVGDMFIDHQHKMWVDIYNKLEQELLAPSQQRTTKFQLELLKELVDFTKEHFDAEEELLLKQNYPQLMMHRRMHKDFHQRIYDLYREALAGEIVLNSEIISLIRSWFISHTTTEDKKAFWCIKQSQT